MSGFGWGATRGGRPRLASTWALLAAGALTVAGCGMESSDTLVRAQGSVEVPDEQVVKVVVDQFVCPHFITNTTAEFQTYSTKSFFDKFLDKDDPSNARVLPFGPFVRCMTPLSSPSGFCPSCKQPYHLPGQTPIEVSAVMHYPSQPLRISPAVFFPPATATVLYKHILTASGGEGPPERRQWRVGGGSLPQGLSVEQVTTEYLVNTQTGALTYKTGNQSLRAGRGEELKSESMWAVTGTPRQSGTFNFTLEVRDARGNTGRQQFSLRVVDLGSDVRVRETVRVEGISVPMLEGTPEEFSIPPYIADGNGQVEYEQVRPGQALPHWDEQYVRQLVSERFLDSSQANPPELITSSEALVQFRSPYDDQLLDPVHLTALGVEPGTVARYSMNQDTNGNYFVMLPTDVAVTIAHPQQFIDPFSGQPMDPTVNTSADGKSVRLVYGFEGPCWRCNGAPSGDGFNEWNYWDRENDAEFPECVECDGTGFCVYEGSLPPDFTDHSGRGENLDYLPTSKRNYRWSDQAGAAPAGGAPGGQPGQPGQP